MLVLFVGVTPVAYEDQGSRLLYQLKMIGVYSS